MTEQYNPTTWVNGETAINQTNLNNIETGITNNLNSISTLMNDMKFKGTITSLPAEPSVGDVYQAASANILEYNKIGDLIVCVNTSTTPIEWHVIPSGPRGTGTVTSVQAGNGISIDSGAITGAGTINIDSSYTAIETGSLGVRNGLMTSEQAYKLNHLADVAESGSFSDLLNIPSSAQRTIAQTTGHDSDAVMSQDAITNALDTKSDDGHHHQIMDIDELDNLLAIDDGVNVRAATDTHEHGLITRDGHFWKSDRSGYVGESILTTNSNGVIISSTQIQSTAIHGTSFGNGAYKLDEMKSDITDVQSILTPTGSSEIMDKAATEDHVHDVFSSESNGFVPKCSEQNPELKTLAGNGQWIDTANLQNLSSFIDIIYPVGCYFETSLTYVLPSGGTEPTAEDLQKLGKEWFNPNVAWSGTSWVLETEGLVHVSGNTEGTYPVGTGNDKGANNGVVDIKDSAGNTTGQIPAYAGIQDGGEVSTTLSLDHIPSHNHGQKSLTGSGSFRTINISDNNSLLSASGICSRSTEYWSGTHASFEKKDRGSYYKNILNVNATHTHDSQGGGKAHNNMQPYINVYRWHRIPSPELSSMI